jgi:plasmid stability protein
VANLQVKSIDDDLYESLGRRAASENRSISQEVVSILKEYLSTPNVQNNKVNQQFLALCGSWQGEESAEELANDILSGRKNSSKHRDLEF